MILLNMLTGSGLNKLCWMEVRSVVRVGVILFIMLRSAVVGIFPPPAESSRESNVAVTKASTGSNSNRSYIEASAEPEPEVRKAAGGDASTASYWAQVEGTVKPEGSGLGVREVPV